MFEFIKDKALVSDLNKCFTAEDASRTIAQFKANERVNKRGANLDDRVDQAIRKSASKKNNLHVLLAGLQLTQPQPQPQRNPGRGAEVGGYGNAAPPRYEDVPGLANVQEAALAAAQAFQPFEPQAGPAYPAPAPQRNTYQQQPHFLSARPSQSSAPARATQAPLQTRAFDPAVFEATFSAVTERLETLTLTPLMRKDMERTAQKLITEQLQRDPKEIAAERDAAPVYDEDRMQVAFEAHLSDMPLSAAVKAHIRDIGFDVIYAALNGKDSKLIIDRSSSTSGAIAAAIAKTAEIIGQLVVVFDPDGLDIHFISEDRREPVVGVSDPAEILRGIEAVAPRGGTPMATEVLGIAMEYTVRLLVNEALPEEFQSDVRHLRMLLIGDGAGEADWQLRVGEATRDGVFIDGIKAPEGSTVTGPLTAAHKVLEGTSFAAVDPLVETKKVYNFSDLDPELAAILKSDPSMRGQTNFEETTLGRAEGTPVAENTLRGKVLVRVPVDMEKDVVVAFAQHMKALDYPEGQMGLGLIPIGKDAAVRKLFTRLTDVPKQEEYEELELPDWVSYVPTPEEDDNDVDGEALAGYVIKAAAGSGNRDLDDTDVKDIIRKQRDDQ